MIFTLLHAAALEHICVSTYNWIKRYFVWLLIGLLVVLVMGSVVATVHEIDFQENLRRNRETFTHTAIVTGQTCLYKLKDPNDITSGNPKFETWLRIKHPSRDISAVSDSASLFEMVKINDVVIVNYDYEHSDNSLKIKINSVKLKSND